MKGLWKRQKKKMKIINEVWELQHRIEKRISKLPSLSLETYFLLLTVLLLSTGFMLFFFIMFCKYDILLLDSFSNPLFYLGLGFTTFIAYMGVRFWR